MLIIFKIIIDIKIIIFILSIKQKLPGCNRILPATVELSNRIHALETELAKAPKEAYACDGVSSRQHNEKNGGQDVWHYHLHLFPCYEGDHLYASEQALSDAEERARYACELKLIRRLWMTDESVPGLEAQYSPKIKKIVGKHPTILNENAHMKKIMG
ncbi:HIT family protein [Paenibacillus sp. NFR01]|uniref:HIT family protein n=1 Tax=Paenibacillus sp. NFR01 TaxID=1566279 RepID=UPI0008BE08E6|nr:HIT domain-containing protein [Paenibacillus sp. NFR01]SEU18530.1 Diadenosine tetraphosphate (Ap4A) hydrolase [Paenibacillus sp. NFR01]